MRSWYAARETCTAGMIWFPMLMPDTTEVSGIWCLVPTYCATAVMVALMIAISGVSFVMSMVVMNPDYNYLRIASR